MGKKKETSQGTNQKRKNQGRLRQDDQSPARHSSNSPATKNNKVNRRPPSFVTQEKQKQIKKQPNARNQRAILRSRLRGRVRDVIPRVKKNLNTNYDEKGPKQRKITGKKRNIWKSLHMKVRRQLRSWVKMIYKKEGKKVGRIQYNLQSERRGLVQWKKHFYWLKFIKHKSNLTIRYYLSSEEEHCEQDERDHSEQSQFKIKKV